MWIDDLLKRNRAFVEGRAPRPLPVAEPVSLAVVACFDPRLDPLLRPSLGLAEGEGFMVRTAGAVIARGSHLLRSLSVAVYLFDVEQVLVVGHSSCKMASFPTDGFISAFRRRGVGREAFGDGDLRHWAGAIPTPRDGVLATAAAIVDAPFLPRDLAVGGAILDDTSGRLEVILKPGETLPGRIRKTGDDIVTADEEPSVEEPVPATEPPASPAAPAPPVPSEAPHTVPEALRTYVEQLAATGLGDDLRQLQGAFEAEGHPVRKLALLQRFLQRATAGSPDVAEAVAVLKRQVAGASHDLATQTLTDLFGPLLGRRKP